MNEIKAQELFDFFTKEGYDLGSFDNFTSSLQDESKRNELHSFLVNEGYDVGRAEDFVLKKKEEIVTESISEDGSSGFAEGEVEEFVGDVNIPQDGLESTPFGVKTRVDGELTSISPTTEAMVGEVSFPKETITPAENQGEDFVGDINIPKEGLESTPFGTQRKVDGKLTSISSETEDVVGEGPFTTLKQLSGERQTEIGEKDITPLIDDQTIERLSGDLDPEIEKETRKFYEDRGVDYDEVRALELRYDELLNKKLAVEEVNEIINKYSQTMTGTGLEITEDERLLEIKEKYPQFFNSQGLPSFTDFSELEQKEFDKISKLIVDSKGESVYTVAKGAPLRATIKDKSNQRLREDLDEYLVSKRKERSSQAAAYNKEAKDIIKEVEKESVRIFGKDLFSVLSELEKGQRTISEEDSVILERLIKEFNSSLSTSNLAAKEYEKSMLYYNRQHNKSLNGEYEDGYKATLNAIRGGAKMGNSIVGLFSVMLGTPGSSKEEVIEEMAKNFEEQSKLPTSRLMTRFQQSKSANELKTAILNNPIGYMASFMGESLAMMLPAGLRFGVANTLAQIGIGAARGGLPGAGAGLTSGVITSFSAANGIVEYGNAFFEAAGEKGYDLSNPDDMLNAMQDEEVWDKADRVGIPRAIAISGVDLAGGTLMSKALKGLRYSTISRGRLVGTALGSQVIIGPAQEGSGEVLAQAVAGQGFSLQETVAEIIGGAGTNIPNIALDVYGIATGKANDKLANDLTSTSFMASELDNISGEKIQSWVYNMRRLGKMTPEQESEILDNLSSVKEVKEIIDNKPEFKNMKAKEKNSYVSVLSVLKQDLKSLKEESEVLGVSIDAEKKKTLEDQIRKLINKEITPQSVLDEKTKESLTVKEEDDAIQESSTEEVDVQEQAGVSEGVREGDTSEQVTTEEITPQEAQELDGGAQIQEVTEEEVAEPGLSPQEIEAQELEDIREEFAEVSEDTQSEGTNLEGNLFLKGAESQLPITERKKRTSLIKRGKSAIRSIRKILPNTKIILHNNEDSYLLAVGRSGRGEFIPSKNTIHINLTKATGSTIAHEVFHAVFIDKVKDSKELQKIAADMVKSVGKSLPKDSALAKRVKKFSEKYKSGIQDEEFLAELVGLLSSEEFGFSELPKPAKNSIIEFFKKIAKKIGIKLEATFGKTDESVIDLINILTRKVSTGEEIVAEDVQSLKQEQKDSKSKITNRQQKEALDIIGVETPKKNATKIVVADILNGFAKSELTPNSSEQDLISRFLENIFEESLYTLNKGARDSGMTWYMEDITEFENKMKVLLPELEDPNQMKLFKQVLAITSSGTNPNQNLKTAYTLWIRSNGDAVNFAKNWGEDKISFITKKGVALGTGVVVRETKTKYIVQSVDALGNPETFKNGTPKLFEAKKSQLKKGYPKPAGFTSRGNIVAQQLTKIEKVYKSVGKDINKLIAFFEKTQPVSELRKYNKGVPDVDGNTRIIAVGKRNGAFIFGEKIGAFYQNMIGIGDTITMDLWWSRTWNRYMGTMLSTVKGERNIQETPRTDRERDIMRKAVTLAANKLNLSVSELQAVIWYFEQELWTKAGKVSPSFSYVTAVNKLNNEIETDEETKKRFSKAGADLTKAEERRQDAISRADNIVNEASGEGVVANRQQIDDSLSKASGRTQRENTRGSYIKAANIIKDREIEGEVLDYGAGLGVGTDAMTKLLGRKVDSFEINTERWKGKAKPTYTSAKDIDKKYDSIVSLNVVNVVPKNVRDFIVTDIFEKLNEGGTAVISSRGFKGDVANAKNFEPGPEEKSYLIEVSGEQQYQKGFDGNELVDYVQDLLGDNATVTKDNTFGKTGVVITKPSESSQQISPRQQLEEIETDSETNLFQKVAQARFAGYKDNTIKAFLKEKKYSIADINEAMKREKIVSLSFPSILSKAFYKSKFHTRVRGLKKTAKEKIKQVLDLEIGRSVELPSSFANVKGGVISGKRLLVDIMTEVTEQVVLKRSSYSRMFETKPKRLSEAQIKKLTAESKKEREAVRKIAIETLEKNSDYKNESEEMQAQMKLDLDRIISGQVGTYGSKMFIENFRVLRAMLSERSKGRAGIKEMQMMLRSFIRQNLPSIDYNKPEVNRLLKAITDIKVDPKSRSTNIDEVMAKVVGYVSEAQSSQVESKINKLLSTKTQKKESGRTKGKGFLPSFQDSFAELKRMIVDDNMAEQKIQDTIDAQRREFEDIMSRTQERTIDKSKVPAEELSQKDLDRLEILQIAIELNSAKMMENKDPLKVKALSNVLVLLQKYVLRGKSENKEELNAYKQRVNNMIAEAFYNVSGGQNIPETEEERAQWKIDSSNKTQNKNKSRNKFLSAFKRAFTGLETYFSRHNALEGLVGKITRIPGEMIGGRFQEMITYRVKDSTSEFTRRKLLVTKMIDDNAKRIFGKDYISKMEKNKAGITTRLYVNPQKAQDIKLKISKEKNETKKRKLISELGDLEIQLSKNQIYYLYNQYKDPANIPAFKAMYGENYAKTMEGLINLLDDETKAWADWQVNVFFPSLYNDYNDVYKRIYRANMPWNQFYAGRLYRDVDQKEVQIDLLKSQLQYRSSIGGQSTKERVKNNNPILRVDGDKALSVYVTDMEYFRAYAETLKEISTVFNNKYVRLAIEENTGKETYKLVTDMLNKLSTRGIKSGEIDLLNQLNGAFVSAKLGINPTVFVKQLTSAFAFADYVGVRNWVKYWVKAAPNAKKLWNEWYDNSPVLQARYEFSSIANVLEGYNYDTISDDPSFSFFLGKNISISKDQISKAQNALMYLVKKGDMGGIMGGISNYLYYKEKFAEKNPNATEQQAIDYASRKATNEATSTQQNSAIEDKDWWQTSGQYTRLMSLFLSAPKALNRKSIMAVRQLYRKSAALGKAMREGKSFKEAKEIARKTGRGSAYENWRRLAIYHSAIPTVFQYVALGMPGLLTDFDDDDLEELGIALILGNLNSLFLMGDLFVAAKDLYLNKPWAGRMKNLSAFMAIEEIFTRSLVPLVNSSSPEKTSEYTVKLIIQILELGGIPAKNVKKLAENYYKLLTGDVEDTGEAVARLLNYSEYVIEN